VVAAVVVDVVVVGVVPGLDDDVVVIVVILLVGLGVVRGAVTTVEGLLKIGGLVGTTEVLGMCLALGKELKLKKCLKGSNKLGNFPEAEKMFSLLVGLDLTDVLLVGKFLDMKDGPELVEGDLEKGGGCGKTLFVGDVFGNLGNAGIFCVCLGSMLTGRGGSD